MNAQPASTKHGLAAGLVPSRADWTIDQGWAKYSPEEHATWKTLFERQTALLPQLACREFVEGMRALPLSADAIPEFAALNLSLIHI